MTAGGIPEEEVLLPTDTVQRWSTGAVKVQAKPADELRRALEDLCSAREVEGVDGEPCDGDTIWPSEIRKILATLPHLRVQETRPTRDQIAKAMHDGHRMHPWGGTWSGGKCTEVCREGFRIEADPVMRLLAEIPAAHPRPVETPREHAVCNACGWDGHPGYDTCPSCGKDELNYFTPASDPHPRPVVDREALIKAAAEALYRDRWDGDPTEGQFAGVRYDDAEQQATVAISAALALLPTEEGEGS